MKNSDKEFHDLMKMFEATTGKQFGSRLAEKEDKKIWSKQCYYQHGETNRLFIVFLAGYQLAKSMAIQGALPLHN